MKESHVEGGEIKHDHTGTFKNLIYHYQAEKEEIEEVEEEQDEEIPEEEYQELVKKALE